ncbi:uncharacterized protein LOC144612325 [Rhinoraja longicauda]
MKSKQLSVDLRDRVVSRHRSGEGYKTVSARFQVPRSPVAAVILKWKKLGTTRTLHRVGRPAKLSNWGRMALVMQVTKNPMVTLKELQSSSVKMGETSRRTTISAAFHQPGLCGRVVRGLPLLCKRHLTARLEFVIRHLKDSQTMRNKLLWSDETKIELFGLNAKQHLSSPDKYHTYSEVWWWQHQDVGMFFSGRNWKTGQDRGKDERSKVQRDPL